MTKRVLVKELGKGGVQQYLKDQVELYGGIYDHFTSPGRKGVPDLIITWRAYGWARVHFVETKTIGGDVKSWQERDHNRRRNMGALVFVIWTKDQAERYVKTYGTPPAST
jgi:hypothetical protein